MKLLALDTSSLACSVALLTDGEILQRYTEREREHTKLVVPMIEDVLAEAGTVLRDVDAFVLGNGPGSFIGLRISASLVQGMAFGVSRPVVPVSSMLAVAEAAFSDDDCDEVIVAQDAPMNEAYVGRFARSAAGDVEAVLPESLHPQTALADLQPGVNRVAAGAGWARYPGLLAANEGLITAVSRQQYPAARHLLPAARHRFDAGQVIDPADIEPSYLRQTVATPPARP